MLFFYVPDCHHKIPYSISYNYLQFKCGGGYSQIWRSSGYSVYRGVSIGCAIGFLEGVYRVYGWCHLHGILQGTDRVYGGSVTKYSIG